MTTIYRMVSTEDANVYEDLQSTTYAGALAEALEQLGWKIVKLESNELDTAGQGE